MLAYGCTSASVVLGADRVSERLAEAKPDTPTSNPITAAFAAFDALGARRIGVLTPYRRDVNEKVHGYITRHGYEVPVFGSFNEEMDPVVATIDEDSLVSAIDTIRTGHEIDAVFVSCTRCGLPMRWPESSSGPAFPSHRRTMPWPGTAFALPASTKRWTDAGGCSPSRCRIVHRLSEQRILQQRVKPRDMPGNRFDKSGFGGRNRFRSTPFPGWRPAAMSAICWRRTRRSTTATSSPSRPPPAECRHAPPAPPRAAFRARTCGDAA